jgi:RHS repeat-associated protein
MCEERDGTGSTVTKRFFAEGEQRIGGSDAGLYYYARDHLGSIRELLNNTGSVVGRYDYDPYGRSTTVVNNTLPDFNFTGLYRHSASNLDFAIYRAYDANLGRWLTRDPIGEEGGVNLYAYVFNGPLNLIDPFGLAVGDWWDLPSNYRRAQEIAREELAKHRGHNDCDDAIRHAEWSQRMTQELGNIYAWAFGTGHEITDMLHGQPLGEMTMDLHNNGVGRSAAGRTIDQVKLQTSPGFGLIPWHPYR